MPGESAANRGRPSDWCAVGAGRLGLAKREACCRDDDVDELGLSSGQTVTAELVFDSLGNIGETHEG